MTKLIRRDCYRRSSARAANQDPGSVEASSFGQIDDALTSRSSTSRPRRGMLFAALSERCPTTDCPMDVAVRDRIACATRSSCARVPRRERRPTRDRGVPTATSKAERARLAYQGDVKLIDFGIREVHQRAIDDETRPALKRQAMAILTRAGAGQSASIDAAISASELGYKRC